MKHSIAVFFRFLAILVVIFTGITAAMPQSTVKEKEAEAPSWSDVDIKKDTDIVEIYNKGIITGGRNGKYGVGDEFIASEAAYALVKIYELENDADFSFEYYSVGNGDEYIEKAKEYNLWFDSFPAKEAALTKEQFAAVLSLLVKDEAENGIINLMNAERYTYPTEILKMYNHGIMTDGDVAISFSPETVITRGEAVKMVAMYLDPEKRIEMVVPDYAELESRLTEKMSGFAGDWSLYFKDCTTGQQISINSHQVYSASLIKLFVAQTAYQKISEGTLKETSKLQDEIRKMITYSDNEAWKYIARQLGGGSYSKGMAATTEIAQNSGFADTGTFYKGSHKNYNFTSVDDCGAYLSGILEGKIVSPEYSEKILSLLKQQQHLQKIPSGVPDSVETANKTGELEYIQGDAAIVYAPSGTYILVIIGDSLSNGYGQISRFTELSQTVYEFLN